MRDVHWSDSTAIRSSTNRVALQDEVRFSDQWIGQSALCDENRPCGMRRGVGGLMIAVGDLYFSADQIDFRVVPVVLAVQFFSQRSGCGNRCRRSSGVVRCKGGASARQQCIGVARVALRLGGVEQRDGRIRMVKAVLRVAARRFAEG